MTPENLADEVRRSSLGGVHWAKVHAEAEQVTFRVGLVPSLDGLTFQAVLATLPGVASASVEGVGA